MRMKSMFFALALIMLFNACTKKKEDPVPSDEKKPAAVSTLVTLETTKGDITIELDELKAPLSAANFLHYVDSGFYDNTIFHRVIPGFVVQGGGHLADMSRKETGPAIKNEADNGLSNLRGTLALARTSEIDSATSQFFINLVDNQRLDHREASPQGFGYCVFGRVIAGMEVVDAIAMEETGDVQGHQNVPLNSVVILKARRADS